MRALYEIRTDILDVHYKWTEGHVDTQEAMVMLCILCDEAEGKHMEMWVSANSEIENAVRKLFEKLLDSLPLDNITPIKRD